MVPFSGEQFRDADLVVLVVLYPVEGLQTKFGVWFDSVQGLIDKFALVVCDHGGEYEVGTGLLALGRVEIEELLGLGLA